MLAVTQIELPNDIVLNAKQIFSKYRSYTNQWLNVEQIAFGKKYEDKGRAKIPDGSVRDVVLQMHKMFWEPINLTCNLLYLQKTHPDGVKRHRDPFTDKIQTTICYFGEFEGGELCVENPDSTFQEIKVRPGTIVKLPCTNITQGPYHWTKPHTGNRYSIIMNLNKR